MHIMITSNMNFKILWKQHEELSFSFLLSQKHAYIQKHKQKGLFKNYTENAYHEKAMNFENVLHQHKLIFWFIYANLLSTFPICFLFQLGNQDFGKNMVEGWVKPPLRTLAAQTTVPVVVLNPLFQIHLPANVTRKEVDDDLSAQISLIHTRGQRNVRLLALTLLLPSCWGQLGTKPPNREHLSISLLFNQPKNKTKQCLKMEFVLKKKKI